ncbi:isoleucine--tRNA ligase [Candidatus Dependentiae bacterium]|nr:MAG: isoleucine--tRNA ligase [Candidatus Dependentiae bacterium]
MSKSEKKSFKHTLHLPTTSFAMRPSPATDDSALVKQWEEQDLFEGTRKQNQGKESFLLHFGPPYANGNIHVGHALTEVLKDFVSKSKRMEGLHAPLVPGWDCHGLPIEFKVTSEQKISKEEAAQDPLKVKKLCREYAAKWIGEQKKSFKQLGILASWDTPYITMDASYEASIIRSFAQFVTKGHIERKGKAVPWCLHCQTVLASAEIEYKDRKDPSTYISFPCSDNLIVALGDEYVSKQVSVLIWTTTPWTIPLNRAVLFHPDFEYELVETVDNTFFLMSSDARVLLEKKLQISLKVMKQISGSTLSRHSVQHPITGRQTPLISDASVEAGSGTSFVHCAPGCGPEDYLVGLKNRLEIFSPVNAAGIYMSAVDIDWLEGLSVLDGQWAVLKWLKEQGSLFHKESLMHSYPHCWRCHEGLIFRATDQWFCNLEKNNLIEKTVEAIEKIEFIPEWGKNRFISFVTGRAEWCISRQRQWGVPIPVLHDREKEEFLLSADFINGIADAVEKEGIEYWDRVSIDELHKKGLIPDEWYSRKDESGSCRLTKETDILDVWFDSGVSHHAVLEKDADLKMPADMYLEGSDQHRGWFQSSVLTSMIMHGKPPMKQILTHGFVVDDKRHKMSKSKGNVIGPDEIIKKYGVDVLRLWVASVDYERDVVISYALLDDVSQTYRKIRNTARFLLSNLFDFDNATNSVPLEKMRTIDQIALARLHQVMKNIRVAYEECRFTAVVQELQTYCVNDLSAWYFDMVKDILYTDLKDSDTRRSVQTALHQILDALAHAMAPILSFTAEYIHDAYVTNKKQSIHKEVFIDTVDVWSELNKDQQTMNEALEALTVVRSAILKSIERERSQGHVKHSLEASISVAIMDESLKKKVDIIISKEDKNLFFKELCIVSQASYVEKLTAEVIDGVALKVEHAAGKKCPRCWQWDEQSGVDDLCRRCVIIVQKMV